MTDDPDILRRLRREILTGALRPGEPITELQLAARLGVSPTPVREAVWHLVAEGYVEGGANRRRRVARPTPRRAVELMELLSLLVPAAIDRADSRAPGPEMERLADRIDDIATRFDRQDGSAVQRAAHSFGTELGRACRQPQLARALDRTLARAGSLIRFPDELWLPWPAWAARIRWIAELFRDRQLKRAERETAEALEELTIKLDRALRTDRAVTEEVPPERPETDNRHDTVLRRLRTDIVSGALRTGDPVRETELARRYQVSSTPVREAIRILMVVGLIDGLPHRVRRVAALPDDDLVDLLDVGRLLLGWLCDHALPDLTRTEFAAITEAARRVGQVYDDGDPESLCLAVHTVYELLGRAGHNNEIWRLLDLTLQRSMVRWQLPPAAARTVINGYRRLGEISYTDRMPLVPQTFDSILASTVAGAVSAPQA
ncbi:GntR family transcriptional regulator [Microlunatus sp. GCM10028923]|uniref:GntR family transcriptional regulator n=1 Tax=Microlunatus sp. GCM10028923 TaxID=3273400 RepID=UPI00361F5C6F